MGEPPRRVVGLIGLYDDPGRLLSAAAKVRDAGYTRWDCHTPYPVHGLDEAMGLRPSPIPYITLGMGFVGLLAAIILTGGLSVWHYPVRIGGKPLFSWQAFVPIFSRCSCSWRRWRRWRRCCSSAASGVGIPRCTIQA